MTNIEKCCESREDVENMAGACAWHAGLVQLHARKHAHIRPHHTHAPARAHTHTHKYVISVAFPRQQRLGERACYVIRTLFV